MNSALLRFKATHMRRNGSSNTALLVILGSLILLGGLIFAIVNLSGESSASNSESDGDDATANGNDKTSGGRSLEVYCAAGIKNPVSEAAKEFEADTGISVHLQYGGSGTLLSNLQVAKRGDLYLAADTSYIEIGREKNLLEEAIPLARQRPVIAVKRGNPKNIQSIDDLLRDDVTFALANPEAASIGKLTQKLLEKSGQWEQVSAATKVFKGTVNEILLAVQLGSVDAAVVWDALASNHTDELEAVHVPVFETAKKEVTISVLKTCRQPARALMFARYLQAPDKGQESFAQYGFETVDGDAWSKKPKLVFYSGGVNRLAIEKTLEEFQRREGVEINTIYNGCGILVADMKSGGRPDAYFACDVSFMTEVEAMFGPSQTISETDMVIVTKKGNPERIAALEHLGREGLRIGVANEKQSALGELTANLLKELNLYDKIRANVVVDTPTADLLVNQLRTGPLDAVIVYKANVSFVEDKVEVIPITEGRPVAEQPIAIGKKTKYPYLTARLVERLTSSGSKQRFEKANFRWRIE